MCVEQRGGAAPFFCANPAEWIDLSLLACSSICDVRIAAMYSILAAGVCRPGDRAVICDAAALLILEARMGSMPATSRH
jgi:hypothetical protein